MPKVESEQQQGIMSWRQIERAVRVLQEGGVVGYPSETVWGLAALPSSGAAVERLYLLKGREAGKPVQLSCQNLEVARHWLRPGQPGADQLARFWPGPLTLVAWAAAGCPDWLAPGGVVGLRVPDHAVIQALLAASGGTLATSSLNPSGLPAASTEEQAQAYALADFLLPGTLLPGTLLDNENANTGSSDPEQPRTRGQASHSQASRGQASTVFDLRTRRVLREGAISETELLRALL